MSDDDMSNSPLNELVRAIVRRFYLGCLLLRIANVVVANSTVVMCGMFASDSLIAAAEECGTNNEVLFQKHVRFLEDRLTNESDLIQAVALDALGAYDAPRYLDRLRAAIASTSNVLRNAGLARIRHHASPDDLKHVQSLIKKLNPTDAAEDVGDRSITEGVALEVLLASGDPTMRDFATQLIRSALQVKDADLMRWSGMVDLVDLYSIPDLVPLIKDTATDDSRRLYATIPLAKSGDVLAQERLRIAVASGAPKTPLWEMLASDPGAMRVARIDKQQLLNVIKSYNFDRQTTKAIILANLGDVNGLLGLVQGLAEGKDVPGNLASNDVGSILWEAASVGDERFLKGLDELFERSGNDLYRRVDCSAAVVQILARSKKNVNPSQQK